MQYCSNGATDKSSVICSSNCSQTYNSPSGTVSLPNHLRKSITRTNCAYGIIQEPGSYINIIDINMTMPCRTAFLEIRDGPYEDSPLMGKFCNGNDEVPTNFQSSQNHIVIRWRKHFLYEICFLTMLYSILFNHTNFTNSYISEPIRMIKKELKLDSVCPMTLAMSFHHGASDSDHVVEQSQLNADSLLRLPSLTTIRMMLNVSTQFPCQTWCL